MATGTISHVTVLRDARILRQAQERAPQNEAEIISHARMQGRIVVALEQRNKKCKTFQWAPQNSLMFIMIRLFDNASK
jgi:hypothetical protein